MLNEFHAGTSDDNQNATPTGLAPNSPTIILDSPASFVLGNAPFSVGRVFERQYSIADRIDYVIGKHTLQLGADWSRAWDADTNDGGADPNAAVQFGSPLGSYEFSESAGLRARRIQPFQPGFGKSAVRIRRAVLRILCTGHLPGPAAIDSGNGTARRLPGLSSASKESSVSRSLGNIPISFSVWPRDLGSPGSRLQRLSCAEDSACFTPT